MKVIDLLNKIANGEEVPYRIIYNGKIYEYAEEIKWYLRDDMKCELSNSKKCLNDEVEIIEEDKKIEKIKIINNGNANAYAIYSADGTKCALTKHSKVMCDKINEIIDKLNETSDKE